MARDSDTLTVNSSHEYNHQCPDASAKEPRKLQQRSHSPDALRETVAPGAGKDGHEHSPAAIRHGRGRCSRDQRHEKASWDRFDVPPAANYVHLCSALPQRSRRARFTD